MMTKTLIYLAAVVTAFLLIVGGMFTAPNIVSNGLVAGVLITVWGFASIILCLRAAMFASSRLPSQTRGR